MVLTEALGQCCHRGIQKKIMQLVICRENFSPRRKIYSATEKEGLAVVAACKHLLPYVLRRHFTIITDHRALKFLTSKDSSSSRITRWMDSLRDLDFEVKESPMAMWMACLGKPG